MSIGRRRRKAAERIAREQKLNAGRKLGAMLRVCMNCGDAGPHFVPPSFGDRGFFMCEAKPHQPGCRCLKCRAERKKDSD